MSSYVKALRPPKTESGRDTKVSLPDSVFACLSALLYADKVSA